MRSSNIFGHRCSLPESAARVGLHGFDGYLPNPSYCGSFSLGVYPIVPAATTSNKMKRGKVLCRVIASALTVNVACDCAELIALFLDKTGGKMTHSHAGSIVTLRKTYQASAETVDLLRNAVKRV